MWMVNAGITPCFSLHNNLSTADYQNLFAMLKKYNPDGYTVIKSYTFEELQTVKSIMNDYAEYIWDLSQDITQGIVDSAVNFGAKITLELTHTNYTSGSVTLALNRGVLLSGAGNEPSQIKKAVKMGITRFSTDDFSDIVIPLD